jgi:hypothetical protein
MRGVGPTHVEADRHVVGKNSIDAAAKCATKALNYNFGSPRPPLPGITHRAKVIEEERVYEIAPVTIPGIERFISFVFGQRVRKRQSSNFSSSQ